MAHCLLVTHLLLTDLKTKNSGTYRRLSLLVDAVRTTGLPVHVYSTVAPEPGLPPLPEIAARIERELADFWQLEAKVSVAVHAQLEQTSWLLQQVLGILGYGRMPLIRPYFNDAALTLLADALAAGPAFVVAHRLPSMYALVLAAQRRQQKLPPVFFDLDDIEHVVALHGLKKIPALRDRLFALLYLPGLIRAERRALRHAHLTLICSEADNARVRKLDAGSTAYVLPNAMPIPARESTRPARGPVMLMVGIYSYGPNADGADFFIREILPQIRAQLPDAELWLAGSGPERIAAYAEQPAGVRFLGFVDDLDSVYREARLVVCPIRYGSGTRVKLIEAAAWAKPIVSTSIGAEGLGMTAGRDALFADEPRQFAAHCVALLRDDARCDELGGNARVLAENNFDRQRIVEQLARQFAAVIPENAR
jgi:glycosyltransferase involved in cell wall biosynthesis